MHDRFCTSLMVIMIKDKQREGHEGTRTSMDKAVYEKLHGHEATQTQRDDTRNYANASDGDDPISIHKTALGDDTATWACFHHAFLSVALLVLVLTSLCPCAFASVTLLGEGSTVDEDSITVIVDICILTGFVSACLHGLASVTLLTVLVLGLVLVRPRAFVSLVLLILVLVIDI